MTSPVRWANGRFVYPPTTRISFDFFSNHSKAPPFVSLQEGHAFLCLPQEKKRRVVCATPLRKGSHAAETPPPGSGVGWSEARTPTQLQPGSLGFLRHPNLQLIGGHANTSLPALPFTTNHPKNLLIYQSAALSSPARTEYSGW